MIKNNITDWRRPEVPNIDSFQDDFIFQIIDIDFYVGDTPERLISKYNGIGPIVRLYGVTQNGNTAIVNCYGFRPYFFVEAPDDVSDDYISDLKQSLEESFIDSNKENHNRNILDIHVVQKSSIMKFNHNKLKNFLKITISKPSIMKSCYKMISGESTLNSKNSGRKFWFPNTYESNIDFEIRFTVDHNITGCSWIKLPNNKYTLRSKRLSNNCQIEIDVIHDNLIALPCEKEWDKIAPIKILSYDIECSGRKGTFPEPQYDSIIQIANTIVTYGIENKMARIIFTLGTCAHIVGVDVRSYQCEKQMIKEWALFLLEADPDIITGYNILNFDTPYIIDRARTLKVNDGLLLGRIKNDLSRVVTTNFRNKAIGGRETKSVNISGRLQLDVFQIILREHKLRSYTLNNVSFHFLGEQKEDVHHSIITDLQNGDEYTRRRLAVYCVKDSVLPIRLLDKLMIITNHIEMARVTGVTINCLLMRGQQVKVISQLLMESCRNNMLIPNVLSKGGEEFEGATVIEPNKGFYNEPIATLDFMSLYPSIMISYNLCYSTLIDPSTANDMDPNDYVKTPIGKYFVKSHVKKGILCNIVKNLLDARKHVKELLKIETDPLKIKVYDGRQLAIKLSANSVYGFTGAQIGRLPCLEISGSVTAFGRQMIEQTKNIIEDKYTAKNGYLKDAKVIYGDTDSVMIKFGVGSLEQVMKNAKEAASFVSKKFPDPIKLEFEKVYFPYLLINKKRYAGLLFTKPDKYDRIDCKGIETVRRDNCLLVANLISSCLYKILIDRDPDAAVATACKTISDLLTNKIDISLLIITKELRNANQKYTNKQAHSELAERMRKRDPLTAPKGGDRVPFVFVGSKNDKAYEKAEDPIYVLENNIPIDTSYYLENQLSKPLSRLFDPILHGKTSEIILHGPHTLTKVVTSPRTGALSKYMSKKASCIGCKSTLDATPKNDDTTNQSNTQNISALCSHCQPNLLEHYNKELIQLNEYEKRCNMLWTECQRCQGSFTQEVICTK